MGHVSALALPEPSQSGFVPLPRLIIPTVLGQSLRPLRSSGSGQEMGDRLETIGRSRPEVVRLRALAEQTAFPVVPPTALGLPIFFIPQTGRLAEELKRAIRASALLGSIVE